MQAAQNHHQQQTAHVEPQNVYNVLLLLFSAAVAAAAGVSLIVATAAWAQGPGETCRFTITALASQDSRTPMIPWDFIRILAMSNPIHQQEPFDLEGRVAQFQDSKTMFKIWDTLQTTRKSWLDSPQTHPPQDP